MFTPQNAFQKVTQASLSQADINAFVIAGHAEGTLKAEVPDSILRVPASSSNAVTLQFLLQNSNPGDDPSDPSDVPITEVDAVANVWIGSGGALLKIATVSLVSNGTVLAQEDIDIYGIVAGAGSWSYCDTIVVTEDNTDASAPGLRVRGKSNGGGVMELSFDLKGSFELFVDFDCDGGSVDATDAVCLAKFW